MTDFIDPFDHEHSSSGVVLLRRETRRHRGSGAQHSLRYSATGRQRANNKTGGITRHGALSASALRVLVYGFLVIRLHPAGFPDYPYTPLQIMPKSSRRWP